MPKDDALDIVLSSSNQYSEGTGNGGYFTSVHLDDDDSLRVTLDYGDKTEKYKVTVEELDV